MLQGPLLLKLDVQGFELEVLRGSRIALDAAEFVLLEVSTLNYNRGAPLVAEVLDFMNQRGFVLFDIADLSRSWYLFFDTETDYRGNASDLNLRAYFGNQHVIYDGESVLQRYAIPVDVYRDQEKLSEWVGYVPASIAHQDIRQTAMEDIYKEIRAR